MISVLPLSAKNAFVTAYLLESSLARFKNVVCCFQTISCLLSTGSPQPLVYFLPYEREQEVHKCIHPKHFRVSSIKISNVVTKETSQILLQTLCTVAVFEGTHLPMWDIISVKLKRFSVVLIDIVYFELVYY